MRPAPRRCGIESVLFILVLVGWTVGFWLGALVIVSMF